MQVSVTPAPDADRAEGTKQNAGVNGTRYSVSDRAGSATSRWTAGGRRSANGRQAASPPKAAGVQYADSGVDDVSAEIDEATDVSGGRRRDDGIAILEGVVTTEVPPDDEPPTADLDVPQPAWNRQVSGPRPVRAAATGSAAAGERTSSGELPVSVTPPAWDSGQRRIGVRDLPPDVRLRMWRFRAIVVIVVGVVFTIVASWQVGLSLAILAGVIDTVYRSRTAADIEAGGSEAAARRRTRRQLSRMRRAGYLALNARPIPNSREVIDHLVVGPTGVYAIDSERWHKRVPIRTYNGKQLWHGPENKKARLEHAKWEAQQASERLSTAVGFDVPVRAAMAIYGPKIPWDIATIKDVDVFTGTALGKYLKRRGRMRGLPRLSKEQVQAIYDSASSVLPDVGPARTFTPVG
ncbi:MAG TPA: nuclease-related domain-containing protein [Trebonia sp.]|nr:nuclease-related domain-containing protein [Trebonia sp.]